MDFSELLKRRTVRRFDQKPLTRDEVRAILEAARLASCAANLQRLRYIAVMEPSLVAAILPHTAFGMMVHPKRQPVAGVTSPTAFIAVCSICAPNDGLHADAGAAIQSMEFAAWNLGIGATWLGSHKKPEVAALLGVEDSERILYMVALGRPGETPCREDVGAGDSVKYYLDEGDRLHVPKYTVDAITTWK